MTRHLRSTTYRDSDHRREDRDSPWPLHHIHTHTHTHTPVLKKRQCRSDWICRLITITHLLHADDQQNTSRIAGGHDAYRLGDKIDAQTERKGFGVPFNCSGKGRELLSFARKITPSRQCLVEGAKQRTTHCLAMDGSVSARNRILDKSSCTAMRPSSGFRR